MNKETLRMQMLSGVITESEYKAKLEEATQKDSLNEHYVAGGIVGIGAINQIPSRAKADYEDAFEHFLGQKYEIKEEMEEAKEEVKEALQNDDMIYDRMMDMDQEQLISSMLSYAEQNPPVTLTDYLNDEFGYESEDELEEGKEVEEPSLYEEEEMDEAQKPGTFKERSAMAKKARAGKDIGEKGKNFEKIAKSAAKKYGSEEAGKKVAGAVMYGKLNK